MPGKYHRTYLDEPKQEAFEKMQADTGRPSNAYISEAVREKLERDGYMQPRRNLREENDKALEKATVSVRRRRRRGGSAQ